MSANAKFIEVRENETEISAIAAAAHTLLTDEFNINVRVADAIPTIAYAFLRASAAHVASNKPVEPGETYEINLFQLLDLGVSYQEGEDGEKDGNYTPFTNAGQEFKLIIKDDGLTEE